MDQGGGLGTKGVPEQFTDVVAAGFDGLVNSSEPAVISLVGVEDVGGAE